MAEEFLDHLQCDCPPDRLFPDLWREDWAFTCVAFCWVYNVMIMQGLILWRISSLYTKSLISAMFTFFLLTLHFCGSDVNVKGGLCVSYRTRSIRILKCSLDYCLYSYQTKPLEDLNVIFWVIAKWRKIYLGMKTNKHWRVMQDLISCRFGMWNGKIFGSVDAIFVHFDSLISGLNLLTWASGFQHRLWAPIYETPGITLLIQSLLKDFPITCATCFGFSRMCVKKEKSQTI